MTGPWTISDDSLPDWARDRLEHLRVHLRGPISFLKLWNEVLTPRERGQLGGDPDISFHRDGGALGLWMRLQGMSLNAAIVDLYDRLWGLRKHERKRLENMIGVAEPENRGPPSRPMLRWDATTGELRNGDDVIRRVRRLANPTGIHLLLDRLQREGWTTTVPVQGIISNPKQTHDAVRSLNSGLRSIRFFATESGKCVGWHLIAATQPARLAEPPMQQ